MPTTLTLLAAATVSTVTAPAPVAGTVAATSSRWSGGAIVTDVDVVGASGRLVRVTQLGGVVDGVGMVFTDQPAIPRAGEHIAAAAGVAVYAVQRTRIGNTPLWRDRGVIVLALDVTTIAAPARAVIGDAFGTWTTALAGCGGASFAVTEAPVAAAQTGGDIVRIRTDRWCIPTTPEICYDPSSASVTRLTYVDDPTSPDDGRILDADVELNAVDFELLLPHAPPSGTKPALDLQSIATHELGHVLGLAHDCGTGNEPWPTDRDGRDVPACDAPGVAATTMFPIIQPGAVDARVPKASDIAGGCAMTSGHTDDVVGGCAAGRAGSSWLALASLVWLARFRRGARNR
jgi:hypothetical protein